MKSVLLMSIVAALVGTLWLPSPADAQRRPVRVTIWDEQQPAQKQIYANFLGNELAEYLVKVGSRGVGKANEFAITSVRLDDPDQGLPLELLDRTDVLVWWGHVRHGEVKDALVKEIAARVKDGRLSFLGLHSAHWSKPFFSLMNERSIQDALASLTSDERKTAQVTTIPAEIRLARAGEPMTPSFTKSIAADGSVRLEVKLPMCVFPVVRADGKPSHITTLAPKHPIAKGLPATFDIEATEVYGGPFHVPTPDTIVFEEKWDLGETFPAGCAWKVGKGKVFYFRPGHETYNVFKQAAPLKIVENAVRWLAGR